MAKTPQSGAASISAAHQFTLTNRLHEAIKNNEFQLFYQPQVDLGSGRIIGSEALIRWTLPGVGMIPPSEFIPVAEESGLISVIGEWVTRTACKQNQAWKQAGLPPLSIAVNLSGRQFYQQDLVERIDAILLETGLDPSSLDVEITESYAMQNPEFTFAVLNELKNRQIRISMDDFGTGYSSLSLLKQFPIDTLKIDRSFVKDLATDPKDAAIVSAIIVLAHNLGLDVIAEGVETQEQLAVLRMNRCDKMQGFLFSRPIPAADFELLLRSGKTL